MSNIAAGETAVSTLPVICHCHVVPGRGRHTPERRVGAGDEVAGREGLDVDVRAGVADRLGVADGRGVEVVAATVGDGLTGPVGRADDEVDDPVAEGTPDTVATPLAACGCDGAHPPVHVTAAATSTQEETFDRANALPGRV